MGETTVIAEAVALEESGILVHCDYEEGVVTDLLTEQSIDCKRGEPNSRGSEEERYSYYRGSQWELSYLDDIDSAISELIDIRQKNPDIWQSTAENPRSRFPWGIGVEESDILVLISEDKKEKMDLLVSFLRARGKRARLLNPDKALKVAKNLARVSRCLDEEEGEEDFLFFEEDPPRGMNKKILLIGAVGSVVVGAVITSLVLDREESGSQYSAEGKTQDRVQGTVVDSLGRTEVNRTETTTRNSPRWRRMYPVGEKPEQVEGSSGGPQDSPDHSQDSVEQTQIAEVHREERALIPVDITQPGWARVEVSKEREIYQSTWEELRLLVAARPAPVQEQRELDRAILRAMPYDDNRKIISTDPVIYEERFPDSVTRWFNRFYEGHQVSVGCQYAIPATVGEWELVQACEEALGSIKISIPREPE